MLTDVGKYLMGAGEIRDRLGGISRQRVQQIIGRPTFPKPYDSLQMGKVWRIEDVEAWIREYRQDIDEPEPLREHSPPRKGHKLQPPAE